MISLSDLHDATLETVDVHWASGELRLNFAVSIGDVTSVSAVCGGLVFLKCPREHPWGPSVSVNSARADTVDDQILLVVEMQTGDLIEAKVKTLSLEIRR